MGLPVREEETGKRKEERGKRKEERGNREQKKRKVGWDYYPTDIKL